MDYKKRTKKFIYGVTGYGKSYTLIAPILRERKKIIYITFNGLKLELKCMGLPEDYLDESFIGDIPYTPTKTGIDLRRFPEVMQEHHFSIVLEELVQKGILHDATVTIVISGLSCKLLNDAAIMKKLEECNAEIIIEYLCNSANEEGSLLSPVLNSSVWEKVPVFNKLY